MAKTKIYDIKPPKKPTPKVLPSKTTKQSSLWKKLVVCFVILILIGLSLREFISASKATIEIWPKTEKVSFQVFLSANNEIEDIDLITQAVPLAFLEEDFTTSQKFVASCEEVKEKARGTIRVYNKYHLPVTLIAKTRFQSSGEPPRVFLAEKKFTIPANGYTDIKVVAAEPGEEYNIEPSSFSIPGLRKYSPTLYYKVYGKSFSKMQGGRISKVFRIKEEDVEKAKNAILSQAEKEALDMLRKKAGKEYKILEKTLEVEVVNAKLKDAQIGQEKKDFLYQAEIKARVAAVRLSHIMKFIKEYVNSQIPPDKILNPNSLVIKKFQGNVDLEGFTTLDIEFEGEVYSKIDETALKEVSKLQTSKDIKRYIHEIYPEILKEPRVRFEPFFAKRAPRNISNIDISLKFK